MKKDNILADKSFKFAVKIVDLYNHLREEKKDYILSKQVVRSGTSIGANVEEAIGGLSEKDFVAKLGIAYKESRETIYWLRLTATRYRYDYCRDVRRYCARSRRDLQNYRQDTSNDEKENINS